MDSLLATVSRNESASLKQNQKLGKDDDVAKERPNRMKTMRAFQKQQQQHIRRKLFSKFWVSLWSSSSFEEIMKAM
jgi:hypothetical protein